MHKIPLEHVAVLAVAILTAALSFRGLIPPGWGSIAWALYAISVVVRLAQERRRFAQEAARSAEQVAVSAAFAREAYAGFQTICEAAPTFMWAADPDANLEFANKAFRDFLGVERAADIDWRVLTHPDDLPAANRYVADLLLGMELPPTFVRMCRHDGQWRWVSLALQKLGQPPQKLIGIGIDATGWKDAEHELAELVEAKQNFLAVMSHELRTPLTAIIGFCEMLKEGIPAPLPEEDQDSLERIGDAATRLQALVDEVLFFNSLERFEEQVQAETVDPKQCVMAVQELLQPRARQLGLAIAIETTYAPKHIQTDGAKLRRVLVNLVQNALKFTAKGTVTIRVVEDEDKKCVRFAVIDPGIGIDAKAQRHVFEPFWQQRQTMVREVGGLGLGLAVSHRIAALLGGSITLESQPDYGSTFTLVIPR